MLKKVSVLFTIILFFTSCTYSEIVDARVERIQKNPWPRGEMLLYRLSYSLNGKKDSCYLLGNKIYVKDSNTVFYFQVGDSLRVKPAKNPDFYYSTKYKGVINLAERGQTTAVEGRRNSNNKLMSVNHVDKKPLLPGAKNNQDNQRIINAFFNKKLKENRMSLYKPVSFHLKIDSLGKGQIHSVHSNDSAVVRFVKEGVDKLPRFSPGMHHDEQVTVMSIYEIGRE